MTAPGDGAGGSLAESVEEHRETLEKWAETDLPLADDVSDLLERTETDTQH